MRLNRQKLLILNENNFLAELDKLLEDNNIKKVSANCIIEYKKELTKNNLIAETFNELYQIQLDNNQLLKFNLTVYKFNSQFFTQLIHNIKIYNF